MAFFIDGPGMQTTAQILRDQYPNDFDLLILLVRMATVDAVIDCGDFLQFLDTSRLSIVNGSLRVCAVVSDE